MRVDRLTLDGFRNYRRQALELDESCNVIYGENAQGQTNPRRYSFFGKNGGG